MPNNYEQNDSSINDQNTTVQQTANQPNEEAQTGSANQASSGTSEVSSQQHSSSQANPRASMTRRHFLGVLGGVGIGAILAGTGVAAFLLPEDVYAFEVSDGYLLVDTKKCVGCETCMLVCSLAHSGHVNKSLARIQIAKNPLGCYPNDIAQNQCRQCADPGCVKACPTGAMHVDPETGMRVVSEEKCIGCESCVEGCLFTPSRVQWNFEERHAQKCDLCKNTPYWSQEGGPEGMQACVSMCPVSAIAFTKELPEQDDSGYLVNLRNEHWAKIGFPMDDAGLELPCVSLPPTPDVMA